MAEIKIPKKLIEVALPLDDINAAAAREKSIRHGHPSTLHLWWARRPLAAARAVIFAQMVNDPSETVSGDKRLRETKLKIQNEREKLFDIIRDLVKWENTNNEEVLNRAREAIDKSWRFTCELNKKHPQADELFNPEKLPAFHDPFAGGGAIPLEAQRLGLDSHASDLNPVAVMINKAMIELCPEFDAINPVGPIPSSDKFITKRSTKNIFDDWSGTRGIAEDVRRYGVWMKEQAFERIGSQYPSLTITSELGDKNESLKDYVGEQLTPISYIWVRTVKSPNPAFRHVEVPLASNFILSSKKGNAVWIKPEINSDGYDFKLCFGEPESSASKGTKTARGANFNCLMSGVPISSHYIKEQGKLGLIGSKLMAALFETHDGKKRFFIDSATVLAFWPNISEPESRPNSKLPDDSRNFWIKNYGFDNFGKLFSNRQLNALNTFSELILSAAKKVEDDGIQNGMSEEKAKQYAKTISTYLAFAVDRAADYWSTNATWESAGGFIAHVFTKQALPMVWDYAEGNPFSKSTGNWLNTCVDWIVRVINVSLVSKTVGKAFQADATTQRISCDKVISTDPPYFDNISYADLSDYFYPWMRKSLKSLYPEIFGTIAVPKEAELIASPYRHGSKDNAESFFMTGMTKTWLNLAQSASPYFPVTIYYAFKQADSKNNDTASTGWEKFLESLLQAGFVIDGTWPVRTERSNRSVGIGTNALASSIVLVCKKPFKKLSEISRRDFQRELRQKMPDALSNMIGGDAGISPIAPVDLAQSAIGPGMAIFSKYDAILESDGSKMTVHDALILINRAISEYLNPERGNFDSDTLFCDDWFSQYGWSAGSFGEADTLARAKGTSVDGVRDAGVIESGAGKVRLLKWSEYPTDWDPKTDDRTPVWEACHQMIRELNQKGESDAGALLARMPEQGEHIRQLAYHLYTLCERKKWAEEARAYNELIGSWHAIVAASQEAGERGSQSELGFDF